MSRALRNGPVLRDVSQARELAGGGGPLDVGAVAAHVADPPELERMMIELWSWPTPNGQKVHIALEELGLPYRVVPVNIGAGEQFSEAFLAITPNHRIPAIVDEDVPRGEDAPGGRLTLFESGAILIYLAEKAGQLIPAGVGPRATCLQWLMFQMGGVGPMFGQYNHFANYAPEKIPYAIERYTNEVARLHRVLEMRLGESAYLAGPEYSIADIATFPWIRGAAARGIDLADYPSVQRWHDTIAARPGVVRGLEVLAEHRREGPMTDEQRKHLFGAGQTTPRVGAEIVRPHQGR
jgi:GST-like protein